VSSKSRTDWRILGCAAAAGVAVALPAGIVLGRYGLSGEPPASERNAATVEGKRTRDVYSPSFRDDPYVIEQQRRIVESLEQACRETRQNCREAEQARRSVEEAAAGR
jgi:hypothetical protein